MELSIRRPKMSRFYNNVVLLQSILVAWSLCNNYQLFEIPMLVRTGCECQLSLEDCKTIKAEFFTQDDRNHSKL